MQHFIFINDNAGECADQISQEDKACRDKKKVNTEKERTAQNVFANMVCLPCSIDRDTAAVDTKLDLQSDDFLR